MAEILSIRRKTLSNQSINHRNKYILAMSKKITPLTHTFICLFVWGLSFHSRIFHSYGDVTITGKGLQIFYLCSSLMAIEQLGFFSVSHVYNGHFREPVTITPIAERLAVELSLPFFTTYVCGEWGPLKLCTLPP